MKRLLTEQVFFYILFFGAAYIMWKIFAPFMGALILAIIIAVVTYPLYIKILRLVPIAKKTVAALLSVLVIASTIFAPLAFLGYILFTQALAFYSTVGEGGFVVTDSFALLEGYAAKIAPGFSLDISYYAQQASGWLATHIGAIFAGTASTLFSLVITFIALFYMFKDGPLFVKKLIAISPLKDAEDEHIIGRLTVAIRSVVLGTLVVALIQGILTAIGFSIFGIKQSVLWGSVAAIAALIPGVGTAVVFITAVIFKCLAGSYGTALLLALWGFFAVGLIDNALGPYLMGRGTELHSFLVLISVLGGVSFFGPLGILIGPVALTFFSVLLELYGTHIEKKEKYAG